MKTNIFNSGEATDSEKTGALTIAELTLKTLNEFLSWIFYM